MAFLSSLFNFGVVVLRVFSASAEVFLRHHFGERYFSIARYLLGFVALCIVETVWLFVFSLVYLGFTLRGGINALINNTATDNARFGVLAPFFIIYTVLYLVIGALHLIRTWMGNLHGERLYSYSFGVSWFSFLGGIGVGPLKIDEWTIYRFIEPLLLVLLGVLAQWRLSASIGGLFAACLSGFFCVLAFVLFLDRNYMYSQAYASTLDRRDAAIASEGELAARRNTKGDAFSIVRISPSLASSHERWRAALVELARPELVAATVRATLRQPEAQISSGQAPALPVPPPMLPEVAATSPGEGQPEGQRPFDLAASSDSQGPRALRLLSGIYTVGMAVLIVGALLVWLVPNRGAGQAGNVAVTAQAGALPGAPVVLPGVGVLPGIGGGGRIEPTPIPARLREVTDTPLHTEEVTVVPQSGRVVQTPVPAGLAAAASDVTEPPALSVTPAVAAVADGGSQEQTFPAVTLAGGVGQVGLKIAYPGDLTLAVESINLDSDASPEATAVQLKDSSGKVVADFQLLTAGDMVPPGALQIPGVDFSAALPGSTGAANQTITQIGPDAVEFFDTRGTEDRGDDIDVIVFKSGTLAPAFSGPPGSNEETPPGG